MSLNANIKYEIWLYLATMIWNDKQVNIEQMECVQSDVNGTVIFLMYSVIMQIICVCVCVCACVR